MFVLTILVCLALGVGGQHCQEWTGAPDICIQVGYQPGTWIYIARDDTYERLIQQLIFNMQSLVLIPHTPGNEECYQAALVFGCSLSLRVCDNRSSEPLPIQPCYETFQFINSTCFPQLAAAGPEYEKLLGNGGYYPQEFKPYTAPVKPYFLDVVHLNNTSYLVPFLPDRNHILPGWGNGTTPYDDEKGNSTLPLRTDLVSCTDRGVGFLNFTAPCSKGFVLSSTDPLACIFTCPGPPISAKEYSDANSSFVAVAAVSFLACCFTIFLYLLIPNTRRFPMLHGLFLCMAGALAALGLLLAAPDHEQLWCGGHDVPLNANQEYFVTAEKTVGVTLDLRGLYLHGTGCKFQASFLYVGMLWGLFQWSFMTLENALLSFDVDTRLEKRGWSHLIFVRHLGYQVVSLALPTLFSLILFLSDRFGYTYSTAYCFVTQEDDQAWILSFWIVPVSMAVLFGVGCLVVTIGRVSWFLLRRGFTKENFLFLFALTWWLALFTLSMVVIYVFAMAYYIDQAVKEQEFQDDLATYLTCALTSFDGRGLTNCPFDSSSFSYPTMVVQGLNFALMGLVMSTVFLINRHIWRHFAVLCTGKYRESDSRLQDIWNHFLHLPSLSSNGSTSNPADGSELDVRPEIDPNGSVIDPFAG